MLITKAVFLHYIISKGFLGDQFCVSLYTCICKIRCQILKSFSLKGLAMGLSGQLTRKSRKKRKKIILICASLSIPLSVLIQSDEPVKIYCFLPLRGFSVRIFCPKGN